MEIVYRLIVLYFVGHIIWYLFREKKFWGQVSAVLLLIMFVLRLLLIK